MLGAERAQRLGIGRARLGEHAQHERDVIAAGDFELRHLRGDRKPADQLAQPRDLGADARIEHRAGIERGEQAGIALTEADQGSALLGDELHAHARASAIGPDRPRDRHGNLLRLDLADALERIEHRLLLEAHLRLGREMLQAAATAGAEMRTAGLDAIRRGLLDRRDHTLVEIARLARQPVAHGFAGQRAVQEHDLALDPRHATTIAGEIDDAGREFAFRQGSALPHSG